MFTKPGQVIATSAAFAVLLGFAAPLHAQQRRQGGQEGRSGSARGSQRQEQPAPQAQRQEAPAPPRAESDRPADQGRARPRGEVGRSRPEPRDGGARGPSDARQDPAPRQRGGFEPRYVPSRPAPQQRVAPYRNYGSAGSYRRPYTTRRPVFTQRYYSFRPRFSFNFGLSVGYGVAYPFQYYDPYGSYNYGIGVRPGYSTNYYSRVGGLSFEIDPYDADIFVDGEYVGIADDFSPEQMPLTLAAGRHHIELRAPGFLPASFDITVVGGQVIPYQGTMAWGR